MSTNNNPNTFILQEVIDDLINSERSLVSPLMKLNYFARRTKNEKLIELTLNELNGYKGKEDQVPQYRKTISKLIVTVQAYMNRHTVEIPVSMLTPPFNEALRYISVREGIGTIEKMAQNFDSEGKHEFGREIPMEMLHYIQPAVSKLYKSDVRLDAIGARLTGNGFLIIEILNNVRTQLLTFVMEIAEEFGYNIEIDTFNKNQEINNQTIINHMNTTINNTGDGNVVNTGNDASINATISISKGDIQSLKNALTSNGVDESDISELAEIVQEETPDYDNKKLGEKSNNWILKVVGKSLAGVGKLVTGISSNILATLIKQYYGIDN